MIDIINQLKADILGNENILIYYLEQYGSITKRAKDRSCIHCNSSDALKVYNKNNTYRYKCFSCNTEGNAIDLVIQKENLEFFNAVKYIAKIHNIDISALAKTTDLKKISFKARKKEEIKTFKEEKLYYLEKAYEKNLKEKNINKAFEISCIIDKVKELKFDESINYAKYKTNFTYTVNKYMSEEKEGYMKTIERASEGSKELLISPTGSGKTYSFIKILQKKNIKAIFVVPNASNVEQIIQEYNVAGAFGYDINALEVAKNNNLIVLTWDKLKQLKDFDLSEHIIITDEIHQIYNDLFRAKAIKTLVSTIKRAKGLVDITATPSKLEFVKYNKITEYIQKKQTNYNVKIYNNIDVDKIIEIINSSQKCGLLLDNKKELFYIQSKINKLSTVIETDTKESNSTYLEIIKESRLGEIETVLNTSCIVAGVNIKEPNITDIIIVGFKDLGTIKQYTARYRKLKNVNVHVFNNYKEINNRIFEIEYKVSKIIETTEELVKNLNNCLTIANTQFRQIDLNIKPLKIEESTERFYYSEEEEKYVVNVQAIKNACYADYYRNADIVSFKKLLQEYFKNVEIIDIEEKENKDLIEYKSDLNILKEDALVELEKNKHLIVGINELRKNKTNAQIEKYLNLNNLDMEEIKKELLDKNLFQISSVLGVAPITKLYTKYITENSFSYELAWTLSNMSNRARGIFFQQLNLLIFQKLKEYASYSINENYLENRLYNIIDSQFFIGMSYTKEHLEILKDAIEIATGYKISITELGTKINNIYIVESKKIRLNTKNVPQLDYYYYRNINPNYGTKSTINIYTIQDYINLEYLCKKNKLSEESLNLLKCLINKKVKEIQHDFDLKNPFI